MKTEFSKSIDNKKKLIKEVIALLAKEFDSVSILSTDCKGKRYSVNYSGASISDATLAERGYVVRVYNGISYSEHSFNILKKDTIDEIIKTIRKTAVDDVKSLNANGIKINEYPALETNKQREKFSVDVKIPHASVSIEDKIAKMTKIVSKSKSYGEELTDLRVIYEELEISKGFYTVEGELQQSYVFSTANILALVQKDGTMKYEFGGVSGMKGVEILDEITLKADTIIKHAIELLSAKKVVPGTYDIICDPLVSGLIAHEAFGHGVEMDMFVKNRAKGAEFIDEYVASEKTNMHDGALSAINVASYFFDDEGMMGTDTKIIENGILKTGISDQLSAVQLGTNPTGNGRRESYERKAYARMTNTFFAPGKDKLEDMIASIDYGYLLESYNSGMEDPKNWGIQCMITRGREIKNGKLTGEIIAPVLMTGYVPEVLKSISMVSDDELYLSGSGHCGKGYKEWVKTSIGGTYLKLRGRLG